MTAAVPMLSLESVGKRFGRVVVADGVSLSVTAGHAVGIVGPNGAGKSSLFALVSGDLAPDTGRVLLDGRDVTAMSPAGRCRLGIGRTYQVPRAFEGMTTFENALVAAQHGAGLRGRAAQELAVSVLDQTELLRLANTGASALTLLQRKRLEVARALATRPRLLLLDEVAGGLTDTEVDVFVDTVRRIRASGVTIVWIEHVVRALTGTVDRLVCLAGGRIVADGAPREVLASDAVKDVYLGVDLDRSGAGAGGPAPPAPAESSR